MNSTSTAIPVDVRDRIIAAAAELFAQSERQAMPTVDAVRRAARVDMNAASAVMKEWRRAQITPAAPVVVAVPEPVQQAAAAAVTAIWLQAQELANESLRSAQAAWEAERAELDTLRQELAQAFEQQAIELEQAAAALTTEKAAAEQTAQALAAATQTAAEARERAAGLAGQLQAQQEQNAALLAMLKEPAAPKSGKPDSEGARKRP